MTKLKTKEKSLHRAVCDYLRFQYPKILFNSDMSGIRLTMGQAVQAKSLRSNSGFPDIIIYEPRGSYYGLFIELKRAGERIFKKDDSPATPHIEEQMLCMEKLKERGYHADFAIGFDDAKKLIDGYLKL
jgi:hypothetical protein